MKFNYKLFKKNHGTKTIKEIDFPNFDDFISDIVYLNGFGIVFILNGKILFLNKDIKIPPFDYVSGIGVVNDLGCLMVAENGGRSVKLWDVKNKDVISLTKGQPERFIETILKKTESNIRVDIAPINRNVFFMSIPILRKIFLLKDARLRHVAGDGKCRFANGLTPTLSSVGSPEGIVNKNGKIIISDSFNGLIREIDRNEMKIIWGHPKKTNDVYPSKILLRNDYLYVLCNGGIRMYSFATKKLSDIFIYKSNGICNMALDGKQLYILEGRGKNG